MSFIVRYQSANATEHDLFESLDDALARVESLHNDPNAAGAMLFEQVPLRVQTVVRVSIGDDDPITLVEPASGADTPPAPPDPPPGAMPLSPVTPVAPAPPAPSSDDDTGKRRFSR